MEPQTRKEVREARERATATARERDRKRIAVERDYAREQAVSRTAAKSQQRIDQEAYHKVSVLKAKLNWAIGTVVVMLIIVALVLFLV
ncbi:hypothetical protein [Lacticaseibacillus thailandensis]|uniref:Uncharacterized protein n=1 Tax=Lacticaseibacillus thailandensis DSM 22698 = JCM 13996 TaxID=1423810 RepID=A0A0R2CD79_9LACO|nr:hypothetical protein [Lacticaseibacillus thailandensis]KRM87940.1 hypothetical protein FD19_GL000220 [Lacticaseibacillus thailandensis DSM 22698 = JCM 13996]